MANFANLKNLENRLYQLRGGLSQSCYIHFGRSTTHLKALKFSQKMRYWEPTFESTLSIYRPNNIFYRLKFSCNFLKITS